MESIKSVTKLLFPAALVAVVFLSWALPASAGVTFLLDKSDYIENHPNQLVQNFDAGKVDPGQYETCNQPVDEFSNDDCFEPGDIFPGLAFETFPLDATVIFLGGINFQGAANPQNALARGGGPSTFEILFEGGVTTAGMDIGCFAEGSGCNTLQTVRLLDANGITIDSIEVKTDDFFSTFVGFDSTVPVVRVDISGPEDIAQGVDEVRFGFGQRVSNIPTLSEWGMIAAAAGLMMVGVWFAVRRRKARTV
ncbi:MAG: IPTL-CTERM sorting domain-containing protein [Thermodesulfobacteriota bacterium]